MLQKDIINGNAIYISGDSENIIFHSSHLVTLMSLPLYLQICYFFYKNITFGFTIFLYEAFTSFSGEPVYNDWFLSLYNVFFSSLPVVALGVFDQDVSARLCLQVCLDYVLVSLLSGCCLSSSVLVMAVLLPYPFS